MSETVLDYMTRCGISSDSALDHYNSGQLQLNSEPVTSLDQAKESEDIVSISLVPNRGDLDTG